MRIGNYPWLLLSAAIIFAQGAAARGQQFDELAKHLPSGANAIVLLNVEKILNSPLGVQHDWKTKHEQRYAAGLSVIPPEAKQAIFATQLVLAEMTPQWDSSVMRLNADADMASLAAAGGGKLETIGNDKIVALPPDAYAVQFSPTLVGAMGPADRQTVGRWIRESDAAAKPNLSPYLAEAFGYANNLGTPIILAIDLEDIHSPDEVLAGLKKSGRFANQPEAELERLAKMLAGIRGLTLGITIGDKPFGKVKIDFSDDVGLTPEVAKAMLLHALTKRGAMIDELQNWTPTVDGRQVTLEGDLTPSGMKRIFSLFDRPPTFAKPADASPEHPPVPEATAVSPGERPPEPSPPVPAKVPDIAKTPEIDSSGRAVVRAEADAAQAYFKRITGYINDLRSSSRDASTLASVGLWYDSYARKIDELPIVGVDPDLVAYGQRTAAAMRQASGLIRGDTAESAVRQAAPNRVVVTKARGFANQYSYGPHRYGPQGYVPTRFGQPGRPFGTATSRYVVEHDSPQAIRTQESAKIGLTSGGIMDQIDADTAAVRQAMSLKYNENF